MRTLAAAVALVLVASACGGGSDSAELEALREEVATLKAQVAAAVQDSEWPDEYQTLWVDTCQPIVEALADAADGDGLSARDICQCTLDGLMKAFSLKDYESWPQDIKDRAAAPYVTMCWGAG